MSGDTVIRPAGAGDLPPILSLEAECKSVRWSLQGFTRELSDENSLSLVALGGNGELRGYVMARCAADECTVHTIAVLPSLRRLGIATLLMRALMTMAAQKGIATLFLEVRSRNTGAQAFYEALEFARQGMRKAYYSDDNDDAIVMTRILARALNLSV
jgi:ribosomal-protein-alanine N-acetyltransferase